jgi:hypothetical protein
MTSIRLNVQKLLGFRLTNSGSKVGVKIGAKPGTKPTRPA